MLSVDPSTTSEIMTDLVETGNFINDYTAVVVIDYVIYNSYAQYFAYVAIVFEFPHSGEVKANLRVFGVRMEMWTNAATITSLVFEIIVVLINFYYLALTLLEVCGHLREEGKKEPSGQKKSCVKRFFATIQTIIAFLARNPFTVLDFVSCGMTIATFSCWYAYCFMLFRGKYYFQEYPTWDLGVCDASRWTWCSDADVIHWFALIAIALNAFKMVLGVNTVFVFTRALKYFQTFARVRVIFNTFYRGLVDIVWFIIVSAVLLSGYVFSGWQVFGQSIEGLSTTAEAYRYVFEMFLGHFDYAKLSALQPIFANVYFFSYMIIFKFFIINMFLAIVCKNFAEEENRRERAMKKLSLEMRKSDSQLGGAVEPTSFGARMWAKVYKPKTPSSPAAGDTAERAGTKFNEGEKAKGSKGHSEEHSTQNGTADTGFDNQVSIEASPDAYEIDEKSVREDSSWHSLPPDMKQWSLSISRDITRFVDDRVKERDIIREKKSEATDLDRCLEEAETKIKDKRKESQHEALGVEAELHSQELAKLREVHQDQESLSWFIMKREAELAKHEKAKELKQDRYDKMVNAAKSLISSDEQGDAEHLAGRGNALALGPVPEDTGSPH
jgi:hypothetical protein